MENLINSFKNIDAPNLGAEEKLFSLYLRKIIVWFIISLLWNCQFDDTHQELLICRWHSRISCIFIVILLILSTTHSIGLIHGKWRGTRNREGEREAEILWGHIGEVERPKNWHVLLDNGLLWGIGSSSIVNIHMEHGRCIYWLFSILHSRMFRIIIRPSSIWGQRIGNELRRWRLSLFRDIFFIFSSFLRMSFNPPSNYLIWEEEKKKQSREREKGTPSLSLSHGRALHSFPHFSLPPSTNSSFLRKKANQIVPSPAVSHPVF